MMQPYVEITANDYYNIPFVPISVCVNDDYVFIISNTTWNVLYRNNLTLKQTMPCPSNLSQHISSDIYCDDGFLYVSGKTQNFKKGAFDICGQHIEKYNISSNLAWEAHYWNASWNFPEFFILDDTYIFIAGSMTRNGTAGLIKLYKSNMTEVCSPTSHDFGLSDMNYYYRLALSPDKKILYTSTGCKGGLYPGYIASSYSSNITFKEAYRVRIEYFYTNMQYIITPTNDAVISAEAPYGNGLMVCVDKDMNTRWSLNLKSPNGTDCVDLTNINKDFFLRCNGSSGDIECRRVSDGSEICTYTNFTAGFTRVVKQDTYVYAIGKHNDSWILRNLTILISNNIGVFNK